MVCMANAKQGNGLLRNLIGIYCGTASPDQPIERPQWLWLSADGKQRGIESGLVVDLGPGDVLEFNVFDVDHAVDCNGLVKIDPFSILVQGTLSPRELQEFLFASNCLDGSGCFGAHEGMYVEAGSRAAAQSIVRTRGGEVIGLTLSYSQCAGESKRRVEGPVLDPRFMELIEVEPEVLEDVERLLLVRMGSTTPPMPLSRDPILAVLM